MNSVGYWQLVKISQALYSQAPQITVEFNRGVKLEEKHLKARLAILMIGLLARLSLGMAQWLGKWLGRFVFFVDASPARVTRQNLEACMPGLSVIERRQLAKKSMEETGKTLFEMGAVWEWPPERTMALVMSVEGESLLARSATEGMLFLAPHLGNWEIMGLYLASRFPIAALYAPPKLEGFDSYMRDVRERNGSTLIPATQRGVIRLFSVLKSHGVVGVLPDQEPDLSGGIFVPFFGVEANTMKLVSKMVQKTAPKVLVCVAYRLPDARGFKVIFRNVDPDIYDPDLYKSVRALNHTVEQMVMLAPEQYQWEYKRFKRRPGTQPNFYH